MHNIKQIMNEHQILKEDVSESEGMTQGSVGAADETRETLLELSEVAAAQSMLVYLVYAMRTLSATGRIATKYEHLSIDSDKVGRGCASDLAGFSNVDDFESQGVTGAHIIGIVLKEVIREAENRKQTPEPSQEFFTAKRYRKAASGMHVLLNYLKDFYKTDLAPGLPKVSKKEFPLNPQTDRKARPERAPSMSRAAFCQHVDGDDESEGHQLRFRLTRSTIQSSVRLPAADDAQLIDSVREHHLCWTDDVDDINDINKRFAGGSSTADSDTSGQYHCKEDVKLLLEQAIASRDTSRLEFLKGFFKEGSFMRLMVESPAEIVWLHDWHPINELTYCIAIDKEKKRVILSFRPMISKADSKHSYDKRFMSTENPIAESYPGRAKNLKLHRGFYKYLFRARHDTDTTKYDEICAKLAQYCTQFGDEARVLVTGHSMGGALATIMSFYISTDDRFTARSTIEAVSFGAPRVGGYGFADAFRHQEEMGKLRIARFHAERDGVPLVPPASISFSKRGAIYHNNGIDVFLPVVRKGLSKYCLPQRLPKVTYLSRESPLKSYGRQLKEFASLFKSWHGMHFLYEHKNRIRLAQKDPDSPLVCHSLEELYEMREKLTSEIVVTT